MSKISDIMLDAIKKAQIGEDVWQQTGLYTSIKDRVPIDKVGDIGEAFFEMVLIELGYHVERPKTKDRTMKQWDIKADGIKMEVKTATIGKEGKNFQHENIEKDRKYDYLVLIDIAPNAIYMTIAAKHTLPFNERNDNWTKTPKKMHRRATGIHYKWNLNLTDVEDREVKSLEDIKKMLPPELS